jgi:hypothetical protein
LLFGSKAAMFLRALLAGTPLLALALTNPAWAQSAANGGLVPFNPGSAKVQSALQAVQSDTVELFDPVARAQILATELPRRWGGTYLAYGTAGASQAVKLDLASVTPVGQMIVLRGTMTIGSVSTPVQGNLNAKSDQLDLLVLGDANAAGLELGGQFQGLQTFQLSAWESPRLTSQGGKLLLDPLSGS